MKKKKIIILAALLLVSTFFLYNLWLGAKRGSLRAETVVVHQGTLTTQITATGIIQPTELVEVGTQVSGIVNRVYVDYNSTVKKGQILAELDKNNLEQQLAVAESQYRDATTSLNYQKAIYQRSKVLFEEELISLAEFQEAEFAYNNAISLVEQRSADVRREKTNLGFANVFSPIDGVVLSREISEGQTVAATFNTPTLFTIAKDLTRMQVEASVDEADIGNVQIGQRVVFTVDAQPDEKFDARVVQVRLNASVSSNVVTYTCILEANNDKRLLMPGMTATISIITKEQDNALKLENKAFSYIPDLEKLNKYIANIYPNAAKIDSLPKISEKDEKIVWVVEKKRIIPKKVIVGTSDGIYTQIVKGLSRDEVILTGVEDLKENNFSKANNGDKIKRSNKN